MEKFDKNTGYIMMNKKIAYTGKRLKVEELHYYNPDNNQIIYREHVISGDAVVILAFVDEEHILMIQEPRTAVGETIIGIPAGQIDENESEENAALRELEEETRI